MLDVEGDSFSRRLTRGMRFADKRRALFQKRSRRLTKVGQPPNNCWCGGARNSRGYTCPCFDVMEDNVGDGRVSGSTTIGRTEQNIIWMKKMTLKGLAEVGNGTRCWTTKHKVAVSLAV